MGWIDLASYAPYACEACWVADSACKAREEFFRVKKVVEKKKMKLVPWLCGSSQRVFGYMCGVFCSCQHSSIYPRRRRKNKPRKTKWPLAQKCRKILKEIQDPSRKHLIGSSVHARKVVERSEFHCWAHLKLRQPSMRLVIASMLGRLTRFMK